MSKRKDFIIFPRVKFGHLTVIQEADSDMKQSGFRTMYLCLCDCGNITYADRWALESGHKTRCEKCSGALNINPISPYDRNRQCNNTSGYPGVDYNQGKWRARIEINRKSINLGRFNTKEEAIAARKSAEKTLKAFKECINNA